jgi:hypothetical protein
MEVQEAARSSSSCASTDIYLSQNKNMCRFLPRRLCVFHSARIVVQTFVKRTCSSWRDHQLKLRVRKRRHEMALCTRSPTSSIHNSSSAPSQRALSASAKVRAQCDFCRAVNVGCRIIISCSCNIASEGGLADRHNN